MSIQRISHFYAWNADLVLDVRSPSEYNHAHIPGALNLPLFTDEERSVVGTLYKQNSRQEAIKTGLTYFGPRMKEMVLTVEKWLRQKFELNDEVELIPSDYTLVVHCWRGGMRSGGVAWLLDLYGFKVQVLEGGYKAFRNWVLGIFQKPHDLNIIAGNTGAAKTRVLHALSVKGRCVIDLESLAAHKGSAFGNIGMPEQPGQEMFENLLAFELAKWDGKTIWLEDESIRIGQVNLPKEFWILMQKSIHYVLHVPFEKRLEYTVEEYGKLPLEKMINAIVRIKKRLGGLEAGNAINALIEDRVADAFSILLRYYDKWYQKALDQKSLSADQLIVIPCFDTDPETNATLVIALTKNTP
ncbi:MAG: tRNA 2-selenouridine(34) synthase MnmH [Saprospiraceae bacterium]|jgi:tRNA 2-selenouridine synthase|nr:tRNA 2-selenouridine(34) synthase MnmH [Saprospiraceae bacterium]